MSLITVSGRPATSRQTISARRRGLHIRVAHKMYPNGQRRSEYIQPFYVRAFSCGASSTERLPFLVRKIGRVQTAGPCFRPCLRSIGFAPESVGRRMSGHRLRSLKPPLQNKGLKNDIISRVTNASYTRVFIYFVLTCAILVALILTVRWFGGG